MKKTTIGVFSAREDAEKAINHVHNELDVPTEDISYIYKNTEGEVKEVDSSDISSNTAAEGAKKGAKIGGTLGALAGIAAVAGVIPIIGPFLAAGPILAAIGVTGAAATTVAGAAAGAAAGGLIGGLANLGVGKENAQRYADRVESGDVLVAVTGEDDKDVSAILLEHGATDIDVYKVSI